jgi:hypothetical protein
VRRSRRLLATACLLPLLSAGCLTRALWDWSDPDAVPELDRGRTSCRVVEVRTGSGSVSAVPEPMAIALAPRGGSPAPAHLRQQAADGPAWLWVRPLLDFPARHAMRAFTPRSYELDVFDGQHLRRATNNVRLTLHGEVPPSALGAIVPTEQLDQALLRRRVADEEFWPWGPVRRALAGVDRAAWVELLAPTGAPTGGPGPAEPIAFLDPDLAPVAASAMAEALLAPEDDPRAALAARGSLLVRFGLPGREVFARIPVPVLLNADSLELERDGARVRFAWAQRGLGRFVRPGGLPADLARVDLPLLDPNLDYEWSREIPAESGWKTPIQTLLSPFAAILDILIETNPALRSLRDWLFPPPDLPSRGAGRGSR